MISGWFDFLAVLWAMLLCFHFCCLLYSGPFNTEFTHKSVTFVMLTQWHTGEMFHSLQHQQAKNKYTSGTSLAYWVLYMIHHYSWLKGIIWLYQTNCPSRCSSNQLRPEPDVDAMKYDKMWSCSAWCLISQSHISSSQIQRNDPMVTIKSNSLKRILLYLFWICNSY